MSEDPHLDELLQALGRPTQAERVRAERRRRGWEGALIGGFIGGLYLLGIGHTAAAYLLVGVAAVWIWRSNDRLEAFHALLFNIAVAGWVILAIQAALY